MYNDYTVPSLLILTNNDVTNAWSYTRYMVVKLANAVVISPLTNSLGNI